VFVARFLYDRMSFGEAAYAAQPVLSWQITIVGDPLYRPFEKSLQQLGQELQEKHSKLIEWERLRVVDVNLARGVPRAAVVGHLEQLADTTNSSVLTEKLADLYASLGKPESAIETYEKALQLDSSPQQRVRLRFELGDQLAAVNESEDKDKYKEAMANYKALLQENPDYPDKVGICHKLLELAQRLGDEEAAAGYQAEILQLTPPAPAPKQPPM
jgi:tetratricopeptide (TPR) repeat protein